jgi:hypothetical protein
MEETMKVIRISVEEFEKLVMTGYMVVEGTYYMIRAYKCRDQWGFWNEEIDMKNERFVPSDIYPKRAIVKTWGREATVAYRD